MEILTVKPDEALTLQGETLTHNACYPLGDASKISLLTTDQGPFLDDLALALFLGETVLVLPSQHSCYQTMYDALSKALPLDHRKAILAASCAENNEFILWEKQY